MANVLRRSGEIGPCAVFEVLHDAFHGGLDKILPGQWGTAYYEKLGPAPRQRMVEDLGAYTKAFDAEYGTQLYDALLRNGFPRP
jgi:hypothetical protein